MKNLLLPVIVTLIFFVGLKAHGQTLFCKEVYPFQFSILNEEFGKEQLTKFINANKKLFEHGIVMDNAIDEANFIKLLNTEFNTSKFSHNSIIKWCNFNLYVNDLLILNFGMVVIGYQNEDICSEMYDLALNIKKTRFSSIKVLTEFRIVKNKNNIYLFISETPTDDSIMFFFNSLK
jgi:hypothetical protein